MTSIFRNQSFALIAGIMAMASYAFTCSLASAAEPSPALKQVIEGAKKEGKLELKWGPTILGGNGGVTEMGAAMNAMFGTKVTVRFTPGPSLPEVLNAVVIAQGAGLASPTDAIIGQEQYAVEAQSRGVSVPVNWSELLPERIQPQSIEADSTALQMFTTLPGGIIYNTQLAPYKPTKLTDLLKPEWKGKIASTPVGNSFDTLAADEVWGEERAFDFARKLSTQISGLMRCGELNRIATGEFIAFAPDCLGNSWQALARKGAPIAHVVPSDFAARRYYYLMLAKNAANPNAAKLFITFLHTVEGQKLIMKWMDTDLDTYPESQIAPEIAALEKQGVKFHQLTVDWFRKHPDSAEVMSRAAKIMSGR